MTSPGFPPSMFDWNSYRETSPTLPGVELSACSHIGIDPSTLILAKYLCSQYPILQVRKEELAKAVENSVVSKVHEDSKSALGENIFYLLRLVSNLAASDDGISLLCICNVLGNHYLADSTVKIFEEIVKESGVPEESRPTVQNWQSLKPLFENLQGPPLFFTMVDKHTALGKLDVEVADRPKLAHMGALGIVGHLMAMSHLVRGEQPWILAVAGRDAGWVAAVAEWLFGLKVELRGSLQEERVHGEKVLYSNCEDGEKVQMVTRFNPPGVPVDREPIVETPLLVKDRAVR